MEWNVNSGKNIEGKGLFGDLDAWCYTTEEQGRGTLHSHCLVFVKNWDVVRDGLGDPAKRDFYTKIMIDYTKKIMSNKLHELDNES